MLWRVARVLRGLLFVAGLCLVLWLPISFYCFVGLFTPLASATSAGGGLRFIYWPGAESWSVSFGQTPPEFRRHPALFLPHVRNWPEADLVLDVPLWLLAFICLAWPVTSYIVARRRRKGRGFEVQASPGAALPPPESPPARASDT